MGEVDDRGVEQELGSPSDQSREFQMCSVTEHYRQVAKKSSSAHCTLMRSYYISTEIGLRGFQFQKLMTIHHVMTE